MNKLTKLVGIGALSLASLVGCSKQNPYEFQKFGELGNGAEYGVQGALEYLLDDEGNPISRGYHEIRYNGEGYDAKLGACDYELNKDGEIIKANSESCLTDNIPPYHPKDKRKIRPLIEIK